MRSALLLRLGVLNFRAIIAAWLLRFGRLNFPAIIAALLLRFFDLNFRAQGAGCARARLSPAEIGRISARRGWFLVRFFDLNFSAKRRRQARKETQHSST